MKHPVLHIKKGAQVYDDEAQPQAVSEAAGEEPASRPPTRRGLPRRRGSIILPLVVLVLAIALVLRIVPRSAERADIDGWHAFLQARAAGSELLVGIAFSRLSGTPEDVGMPASVAFLLPGSGQKLLVTGTLSGARSVLRGQMSRSASDRVLEAEVRVGTESRRLTLGLPAP